MRILQVDVHYGNSSTGKIVQALHRRFRSAGHESRVLHGRGPSSEDEGVRRVASPLEVGVHAGLTRLTGLTGPYSPFATSALIRDVQEFRPDVVHLHELHGYYVDYIRFFDHLMREGVPVIWTFHCEFMYTGKCGHAHECEGWLANCGRCPQKTAYPASWTFDFTSLMLEQKRRSFRHARGLTICCPSEWLAERVRRSHLGHVPVMRVFNGIDTDELFRPRPDAGLRQALGLGESRMILGVAGDLMLPNKGGRWMLELADRLRDRPVKVVLVGVPESVGSENVVALPKMEDQRGLAELYSAADLLVLPSRKETFSLVCAEALACGTPVVGFESGAPGEVAPAGYGRFVSYGDVNALEGAVVAELFGSATLAASEQCRAFAVRNYSEGAMANAYLDVYRQTLERA